MPDMVFRVVDLVLLEMKLELKVMVIVPIPVTKAAS